MVRPTSSTGGSAGSPKVSTHNSTPLTLIRFTKVLPGLAMVGSQRRTIWRGKTHRTLSATEPYPDGQPDCVPPGGDSMLSARESRFVTRPADEFRVVRRSTEPTVFCGICPGPFDVN